MGSACSSRCPFSLLSSSFGPAGLHKAVPSEELGGDVRGDDLSWEARHGHWVGISQMTKEEMSFADRRTSGLDDPSPG